jgi:hypothetical protein
MCYTLLILNIKGKWHIFIIQTLPVTRASGWLAKISNNDLYNSVDEILAKTGSFTYGSAMGFKENVLYIKNNSSLKAQFTRLKIKQQVGLKMAGGGGV